ncbi:MAG: sigma factor-like helix-turn-helix DNA-binding protein [Eubacteriales bacterium]
MKSQAYHMSMLFDFYGEILTERQKEFYDLYYNEDLSLGEIAQNSQITRQGVRDVIVRAEHTLSDIEDKTGLIKRFHAMRSCITTLEGQVEQLQRMTNKYDDPSLESLVGEVRETIALMQKE